MVNKMEDISSEIREKAHNVCSDYLGKVWQSIDQNDIIINKFSGGYVNMTLKLSLPVNYKPIQGEPTQVVMKIYLDPLEEGHKKEMTDNIIAVILAEKKLFPKVYGIFNGGRLDEYVISRTLVNKDLHNLKILGAIARKLANLHSITLPIIKDPNRIFHRDKKFLDLALHGLKIEFSDLKRKNIFDNFMSIDPSKELKWLKQSIDSIHSPVVYCQGDLQINNILLREDSPNDPIHIIDLDLSGYNYRAYDLANLIISFSLILPYSEPPYFKFDWELEPTKEELKFLFVNYLDEFQKVKNITLDIEKEEQLLLKETELFKLFIFHFYFVYSINKIENTSTKDRLNVNKLDWLEFADVLINQYKYLKKMDF